MTSLDCPACFARVHIALDQDLSLPPTGSDHDWCESRQQHACPACGARLEIRVRVWLDGRATDVTGVSERPPPSHPGAPRNLAYSPDGACLAALSAAGPWLLTGGRVIPLPPEDQPDTEHGCPGLSWSQDGRLLLADGRILEGERVIDRVQMPDSPVWIGWIDDQPAVAWRDLDLDTLEWFAGVDIAGQRHTWPVHSGHVMSGLVTSDGEHLFRVAPPRHGSPTWLIERWRVEGWSTGSEATVTGPGSVTSLAWRGQALVLGVGLWTPDGNRYSLVTVDPGTLAVQGVEDLPGPPFCRGDGPLGLCWMDDGALVAWTISGVYHNGRRIHAGVPWAVATHGRSLAIADPWSLTIDGEGVELPSGG